jgi:hypothetical protein
MSVFGIDGTQMIEKRLYEQLQDQPERREFTINVFALKALIDYHKKLADLCDHDWDLTSPVDGAALCPKCGGIKLI